MTFPNPTFIPASAINWVMQGQAVSTTPSVNIPSCQDGDVGVFIAFSNNGASGGAAAAISTPSGWSDVGSAVYGTGDRHRIQVFCKILTAAESGTTLTGANGSTAETNAVFVLRGSAPISSLASGDFEGIVTSSDPAAVTISCSAATKKAVAAFGFHASRNGDTRSITFTPTYDSSAVDGNDRATIVWKLFADDSAVDIAADTNDAGSGNTFATWYIEAE